MDAWRTTVDPRHADSVRAERRRAVQARTAEEIDASARLSQMPAQLLRENGIRLSCASYGCRAVVLARGVERCFSSEARCAHLTLPFRFSIRTAPARLVAIKCCSRQRPSVSGAQQTRATCALSYQTPFDRTARSDRHRSYQGLHTVRPLVIHTRSECPRSTHSKTLSSYNTNSNFPSRHMLFRAEEQIRRHQSPPGGS